jgi:hypothetical protein
MNTSYLATGMPHFIRRSVFLIAGLGCAGLGVAAVDSQLSYPTDDNPSADEVARQVHFANHFFGFKNFSVDRHSRTMALLIIRNSDGSILRAGIERHLNNNYAPGDEIESRDLAMFHSGTLRGTGILVTSYRDDDRNNSYDIWLPSLRKVRRFAQPDQSEPWGGSVFTFGDVSLRRPTDETHEILGRKKFRTCLGTMEEIEGMPFVHVGRLPQRACRHIGKEVYAIKSTTRFQHWWYDYRMSFVDTRSFADYRTVYFKDGRMVKIIDRDWGVVDRAGKSDPRALFWKYWYGADLVSGRESWAVVPEQTIAFDTDRDNAFWSDRTLRRLNR